MKIKALTLMAMACLVPGLPGQTNTNPALQYERLVQRSADCNGTIMGVNDKGQIFGWNSERWVQVEGELTQISVGSKSEIWGVNALGLVWKMNDTGWQQMPGLMRNVAV